MADLANKSSLRHAMFKSNETNPSQSDLRARHNNIFLMAAAMATIVSSVASCAMAYAPNGMYSYDGFDRPHMTGLGVAILLFPAVMAFMSVVLWRECRGLLLPYLGTLMFAVANGASIGEIQLFQKEFNAVMVASSLTMGILVLAAWGRIRREPVQPMEAFSVSGYSAILAFGIFAELVSLRHGNLLLDIAVIILVCGCGAIALALDGETRLAREKHLARAPHGLHPGTRHGGDAPGL